ncbi:hypothetical protein BJ165DRAFT_1410527 [Panaeolus papilionaceus]|nr:hypothetical protein BJ165DRAFT_1410527 [Panaeolus papilionaceus]
MSSFSVTDLPSSFPPDPTTSEPVFPSSSSSPKPKPTPTPRTTTSVPVAPIPPTTTSSPTSGVGNGNTSRSTTPPGGGSRPTSSAFSIDPTTPPPSGSLPTDSLTSNVPLTASDNHTSGSPAPSDATVAVSDAERQSLGPIIGGVVGGILVLLLLGGAVIVFLKRRRRAQGGAETRAEAPTPFQYNQPPPMPSPSDSNSKVSSAAPQYPSEVNVEASSSEKGAEYDTPAPSGPTNLMGQTQHLDVGGNLDRRLTMTSQHTSLSEALPPYRQFSVVH